jgi:hypothetical protein
MFEVDGSMGYRDVMGGNRNSNRTNSPACVAQLRTLPTCTKPWHPRSDHPGHPPARNEGETVGVENAVRWEHGNALRTRMDASYDITANGYALVHLVPADDISDVLPLETTTENQDEEGGD